MYSSIFTDLRAHRAILDEYLPQWRESLGDRSDFVEKWGEASGCPKTSARRWYERACMVYNAEFSRRAA